MAVKGALATAFSLSAAKPATRDEGGYDGLKRRLITPSAFDDATDALTIPAADYATLIPGEKISFDVAGTITGLAADTEKFCAKRGSNMISFCETLSAALQTTPENDGGRGGTADVVALAGSLDGTERILSNNYKPCGEVISVGEFGREYNTVRVQNLADGATRKFKGGFDNGTFQVDLLFDSDDVGQTLLEAAGESRNTYAVHIQYPAPSAEEFYFEALVMSLKRIIGGPDDALMLRTVLELDHRTIREGTVA